MRTSGMGITGAESGHDCSDGGDNGIYVKGECATRIVRRRDNGRISERCSYAQGEGRIMRCRRLPGWRSFSLSL